MSPQNIATVSGPPPGAMDIPERQAETQRERLVARVFGHVGLCFGGAIVLAILLIAIFAPWIVPHDPYLQDLGNRRVPPIWHSWFHDHPRASWTHPLGTDNVGRDYLSRLIFGARISMLIGVLAMTISGALGTALGVTAGYFGGRVDMVVNFLITTRLSVPLILAALAIVSLYGGSNTIIIVVLGCLIWDRFAVVMRSVTMQTRNLEYVTAARVKGRSYWGAVWGHAFPNILVPLITVIGLSYASLLEGAVLTETVFAWPGLGLYITRALFNGDMNAVLGGTILVGLVFIGINLLSDLLYKVFDPRLRSA